MSDRPTRAQRDMLARDLGVPVHALDPLASVGAETLRRIREVVAAHLFDANHAAFAQLTRFAPLISDIIVAKVILGAVPAEVAGRASGVLVASNPDRAAGVIACLPVHYLADAAPYFDPRAVRVLVPRAAPAVLARTAIELLRRQDFVTVARFVEHADDQQIDSFARELDDDAGLIQVIALLNDACDIDRIVRLIPPQRRLRYVDAVAEGDTEVVLAGISILSRVDADLTGNLGAALFGRGERVTGHVLACVHRGGAHAALLNILACQPNSVLNRIASDPALADPGFGRALILEARSPRSRAVLRVMSCAPGLAQAPE